MASRNSGNRGIHTVTATRTETSLRLRRRRRVWPSASRSADVDVVQARYVPCPLTPAQTAARDCAGSFHWVRPKPLETAEVSQHDRVVAVGDSGQGAPVGGEGQRDHGGVAS